jgi:hypothetical protein
MSIRLVHHKRPVTDQVAWRLALDGDLPADALSTVDRRALVLVLHNCGWTDVEIASHTRMSTYTTARIREGLGLAGNKIKGAVA